MSGGAGGACGLGGLTEGAINQKLFDPQPRGFQQTETVSILEWHRQMWNTSALYLLVLLLNDSSHTNSILGTINAGKS